MCSSDLVTILTNEISTASVEQSEGVTNVNSSIQQMDHVTQQNAATAEEVASTSEEMSAQAQTLQELVDSLAVQVSGDDASKGGRHNSAEHKEVEPNGKNRSSSSPQPIHGGRNGGHEKKSDVAMESLIPMGENRIVEHKEDFSDF